MRGLKIKHKVLLLFLLAALMPILFVQFYWITSLQSTLRDQAGEQQKLIADNAADRLERFITTKVNTLIIYSQINDLYNLDLTPALSDLEALIRQDQDIIRVALANATGQELLARTPTGVDNNLENIADNNEFRTVMFLGGKEYISPVIIEDGEPQLLISVPLVTFEERQRLLELSTSEPGVIRTADEIKGTLVARISLGRLWGGVLSQDISTSSTVYVVDISGQLIAHSDLSISSDRPNMREVEQVANYMKNPFEESEPAYTRSFRGEEVLSVHSPVVRAEWGVISEERTSNINNTINRSLIATMPLLVFSIVAVVVLSYLFSRQLSNPIKQLSEHAEYISRGDFQTHIQLDRKDELGILAKAFNSMTDSLKLLITNLRAESNKLNVVLDGVDEGIVAVNDEKQIVVANLAAAKLTGKLPADLSGKNLADAFSFNTGGTQFTINTTNPDVSKDVMLQDYKGEKHYLDITVGRIDDDPSGISTIIMFIDRTEEKELEMMKMDFVSMAAHELRTPMTSMRGYLKLIDKDSQNALTDKSSGYLKRAQASSLQLTGLINNLLNVAKIERGAFELNKVRTDWKAIVKGVVEDHNVAAKEGSIQIASTLPEEEVYVYADELAVTEVINNLTSNALHYTPPDGSVSVSVEIKDNQVLTGVHDTGVGIPKEAMKNLFTKFYRVKNGLDSGSGGNGLGLYISKSIVELHGGKIWAESEESKGSTFYFTLPLFNNNQEADDSDSQNKKGINRNRGWVTKSTSS